ncbi:MAG: PAS domain-containing protein [Nitrospinae bacterium]|nr:PAS domain-containing protein [Nitrospinota bacterium]
MNPLSILTTLPHGVAVFDPNMRVVFVNHSFCEMFNASASPGVSAQELFSRTPEVVRQIRALFVEGKTYVNHEFDPSGGKGGAMTLRVHSVDYGEAGPGACVICQSDEGKRELQTEFEKEDKMTMLSMITAGLAHEIKNPLSGIKGAAQLISKESGEFAELCRLIINETDRINSLVNEMTDAEKPAGRRRTRVNIHRILDDILILQKAGLDRRKISVVRDYDPSLPPLTVCEDRLKTTPEVLKHLFTPFNTGKKHGTGLGLVISLKIVRDHGGTLTLENNPSGRGAVARVLLPLQ